MEIGIFDSCPGTKPGQMMLDSGGLWGILKRHAPIGAPLRMRLYMASEYTLS